MANRSSIAVVGAGPVGTLMVASLLASREHVTWVVRNEQRRSSLEELTLQFSDGPVSFDLADTEIVDSVDELTEAARIIVAVKAYDLPAVLQELASTSPRDICAIGNGLQQGSHSVGLLYGGGFLRSGTLVTGRENKLVVGSLQQPNPRHWLADTLNCDFLRCEAADDIERRMWLKLAVNCVINPLTALLDCDNGDLLGLVHGPLAGGIIREVIEVMKTAGVPDPPTAPELLLSVKQVLQTTRYNSSSMREDLQRDRRTEIDQLNGSIVDRGMQLGVDCPVNNAVVDMLCLMRRSGKPRQ